MASDPHRVLHGLPFTKMTGSGNDFVFFDGRIVDKALVTRPEVVAAICNRHNGIGGDGVVVLEPAPPDGDARILYFNSDGSPADLCGNATLCSTTLSVSLGLASGPEVALVTPAGRIRGRIHDDVPEIDLGEASTRELQSEVALEEGELKAGFVMAGIPHLVILCENAELVDVEGRGPALRRHQATGPAGANVNWVSARPDGSWRYRTFERGVEGETLACGTGAVATAVQLAEWHLAESPVRIISSSARELLVRLVREEGRWRPTLRGEGRVVFTGEVGSLSGA
jgi:diaminopimelate epimerase